MYLGIQTSRACKTSRRECKGKRETAVKESLSVFTESHANSHYEYVSDWFLFIYFINLFISYFQLFDKLKKKQER